MPKLPSTRGALREALIKDKRYTDRLMEVSETLGRWIEEGQARGEITLELPAEVVLYTLFARTCDPVVDFLKGSGNYSDAQIIDLMRTAAFGGIASRKAPAGPGAKVSRPRAAATSS
jgi:hypothetical protein